MGTAEEAAAAAVKAWIERYEKDVGPLAEWQKGAIDFWYTLRGVPNPFNWENVQMTTTKAKVFRHGDRVKLPEWLGSGTATVRSAAHYLPPSDIQRHPEGGVSSWVPITPDHSVYDSPPVWVLSRFLVAVARQEPTRDGTKWQDVNGRVWMRANWVPYVMAQEKDYPLVNTRGLRQWVKIGGSRDTTSWRTFEEISRNGGEIVK